jgi:hypothetical protein
MRLREFFVGNAPSVRAFERRNETIGVNPAASVKAEHLLVNVGFEMERGITTTIHDDRRFNQRT